MKKDFRVVLFSIWCAVSAATLGIGIAIENNILKFIGGISMIIIILMVLCQTENNMKHR